MQVLQDNNCSILIDWTDSIFCETLLAWDYKNGMANLSMPVYIEKFHPPNPNIAPLSRAPQIMDKNTMDKRSWHYGNSRKKLDLKTSGDCCVLLYYGIPIDSTVLPALCTLAAVYIKNNKSHGKGLHQVVKPCCYASQLNAIICYTKRRHDYMNSHWYSLFEWVQSSIKNMQFVLFRRQHW